MGDPSETQDVMQTILNEQRKSQQLSQKAIEKHDKALEAHLAAKEEYLRLQAQERENAKKAQKLIAEQAKTQASQEKLIEEEKRRIAMCQQQTDSVNTLINLLQPLAENLVVMLPSAKETAWRVRDNNSALQVLLIAYAEQAGQQTQQMIRNVLEALRASADKGPQHINLGGTHVAGDVNSKRKANLAGNNMETSK